MECPRQDPGPLVLAENSVQCLLELPPLSSLRASECPRSRKQERHMVQLAAESCTTSHAGRCPGLKSISLRHRCNVHACARSGKEPKSTCTVRTIHLTICVHSLFNAVWLAIVFRTDAIQTTKTTRKRRRAPPTSACDQTCTCKRVTQRPGLPFGACSGKANAQLQGMN